MSIEKYDWLIDTYNQINFTNLPHGIIINGPAGIGKKILAKEISQKIISNFKHCSVTYLDKSAKSCVS